MSTGEETERVLRCPICGKPAVPRYRPFCSKRCADIDLGRWLIGRYAIPMDETEDREELADEIARDPERELPHDGE